MELSDIYQKASLVQIPSGYKSGTLYSVVPNTSSGDFTVTGDPQGEATRVNKDGLIESVSADVPRLNYDPSNPQDPHLLLEPTRTNQISKSRDFEGWSDLTGGQTITNNVEIAPDGTYTAATIERTSSGYSTLRFYTPYTNYGTVRSASIYIKKLSGNPTVSFGITDTQDSITPTDEWIRYTKDNVTPSDLGVDSVFVDIEVSGVSGDKIAVWGAQLEEGSYSTSLIPTSGSAVTRTVDTCKLENFTNAPTDYPFTVFCEMDIIEDEKGYGFSIIDISSSSNYFSVGYSEDGGTLGKFRFTNRAQGTGYNFNTLSTYGTGRYKIAVKFISATNFKGFINGVEVADYTHPSSPFNTNINDVLLGQLRVSGDTGDRNPIHQFKVFNEALTDAELITLTT